MRIPLIVLLIQGIPEQIGVVALAFALAKIPLNWKRECLSGIVLALTAYLLRMLPITFGVHTIILIGILFFILYTYGNVNLTHSIVYSLISFLALIIFEMIFVTLSMNLFGLDYNSLMINTKMRILVAIPQVIMLYLTAYIVRLFRK